MARKKDSNRPERKAARILRTLERMAGRPFRYTDRDRETAAVALKRMQVKAQVAWANRAPTRR